MGERGGVGAALAACGVDVALDGVVRLVAGLVERAQVHPGGGVAVVQLHGADVRLQSVHGLVLLLVQHPEGEGGGEEKGVKGCVHGGENEEEMMMRIGRTDEVFFMQRTMEIYGIMK